MFLHLHGKSRPRSLHATRQRLMRKDLLAEEACLAEEDILVPVQQHDQVGVRPFDGHIA